MNSFLVMVNEEYCDGQAIITHPDGQFGGEHYVELRRTYPICIGTYRSESAIEAIDEAAREFEYDKNILSAIQVTK